MQLGEISTRAARYWPRRTALIDARRRLSFAEVEERASRLAAALAAVGCKPGDRVAVQAWNRAEVVELEIAAYKGGFIKVPLNARLSVDETVHTLQDSQSQVLVADAEHADALASRRAELPLLRQVIVMDRAGADGYEALIAAHAPQSGVHPSAADDVAVLHYTSGSSGVLKAAMQTFGNRQAMLRKFLAWPVRRALPGDVQAHVGPITHASGMHLMYLMHCGATSLLLGRFDEVELLEAIQREKVTRVMMVPTMINRLVAREDLGKYDLSSLNSIQYGAAPMAPALVEKAIKVFGPILAQGYGAGETSSMVTVLTEQDHVDALANNPHRLASCGRCFVETEVRVVNDAGRDVAPGEVGEVIVRGDDVMKGYWNAPELTAQAIVDGYYRTGDLAKVDNEGFLYIVDRKKEMIISGGFNIYPAEVEQVLYAHPAVFEAAAVGVPDDEWGECVRAVVVLRPGAALSADELLAYCTPRLPGFKRPRSVDFIDALPKNPNGKVVRRVLRDQYWAGRERRV